jgi:hypothetical protein
MSKVAGFALIVAGLGVGVLAIAPLDNFREQPELAQSPTIGPTVSGGMLKPEIVPMLHSPGAEASRFSSPLVTTVSPHVGRPRIPQERLSIPKDRDALTREIQKELRRVGCYEGDINGTWSQSTRRAMKTFIERMNARLPTDEPDAVLYALVKSQDEPICGIACPHAERESADERCVPNLLLHVQSKTAPSATLAVEKPAVAVDGSVGTTPQSTEPSLEGRMGLAGPSAGPTVGTTTHTPRDRATPAATAIFSPRVSNN